MKKKLSIISSVFLIIFFIYDAGIHAAAIVKDSDYNFNIEDTFHFSARVQAGYLTGTANELVYAGSYSNSLISKLIWEIDSLFLAGLGCSFQYKFFAFHLDGWFKTEDGDGTMDDYDWMIEGEEWTDWSHHTDTPVSGAVIFDINTEVIVPQLSSGKLALSGIVGLKIDNLQWKARGGSYIYTSDPDTTFRDLEGNFEPGVLGITYEQTFYAPYLGIGMRGRLGHFEFAGRLAASIWSMTEAKDTHHMRDMYTIASMDQGDVLLYDVSVIYNFTESYALEVGYQHTDYETTRGNSVYHLDDGTVVTYRNGEGADLKTSMFTIKLMYSF